MEIIIGCEGGAWAYKIIDYLLNKLHPGIKITYKNDDTCKFIIKGHGNKPHPIWNDKKKKYIYFSGESYIPSKSKFETEGLYIITTINNNLNSIYYPYVLNSPYLYKERKYINNDRKYLLAYCSKNGVKLRQEIFNLFVEKTSSELCHSLSSCCGKYPNTKKPRVKGQWNDIALIEAYKDYKFVIAMENKYHNGYVTEKILNAFYSGAIPIYWGSSKADEFFNKNAFINVSDFNSLDECVEHVINMDEIKIKEMLKEPIYNEKNDLINLMNDNYNNNNDNIILKEYLHKLKLFLD